MEPINQLGSITFTNKLLTQKLYSSGDAIPNPVMMTQYNAILAILHPVTIDDSVLNQ